MFLVMQGIFRHKENMAAGMAVRMVNCAFLWRAWQFAWSIKPVAAGMREGILY
jgi:hypothetical protein